MFKNNSYINKLYFKIIFVDFAKIFIYCLLILFLIIFSLNFSLNYSNYNFTNLIIISFYKTLKNTTKNINLLSFLSCLFYCFLNKNYSNFNILKSFGISSKKIIRPILLFLAIISLFNTFLLQPISINIQNKKNFKIDKKYNKKDIIFLEKNKNFKIINNNDIDNSYQIISGSLLENNNNTLYMSNIELFEYNKQKLIKVYFSKNGSLSNKNLLLNDVIVYNTNKNNLNIQKYKNFKINTNFTKNELLLDIIQDNKIKKKIKLDTYDYLKLFSFYKINKNNNYIYSSTISFITKEIVNFFNCILSCFIVFLFCISLNRNNNIYLPIFKSSIIYFIIIRIFKSLYYISETSFYCSLLVCSLSLILCIITYFCILNADWCNLYYKMFKKILLNILSFFKKNYF